MKQFIFLFSILIFGQSYSQKMIEKKVDGSNISAIEISGNNMFKIHISTQKTNKIKAVLNVAGENSEQVLLKANVAKDTLLIGSSYQPMFTPPDDKSSAHRKISIELRLVIPERLSLNISSDIASVYIKGNYKNIIAELLNGNFKTIAYSSSLLVNTVHGNISIESNKAQLELYTKNGEVYQEKLDEGNSRIVVNSINGNISVTKTQ